MQMVRQVRAIKNHVENDINLLLVRVARVVVCRLVVVRLRVRRVFRLRPDVAQLFSRLRLILFFLAQLPLLGRLSFGPEINLMISNVFKLKHSCHI